MIFKRLPIKYKLVFFGVFTSSIALILGLSGFIFYNWLDFKKSMIREVRTLAQIMAYNSAAPLMFNDKEAAKEILSALKVKKHIVTAIIYTPKGTIFAKYGKNSCPFKPYHYTKISENGIYLLENIVYQGEKVGSICIKASLSELYQNLKRYLLIGLVVFLISLTVSLVLSSYLQRLISIPILKIAEAANMITKKKDYSLRVETEHSTDELGILVRSFNAMLAEIENRDANLEYLVAQRTKELEEAVERLKEIDRMKSEFLSNVSHELRTPLTSVRGFASVIKKQFEKYIAPNINTEDKKVKKAVEKIRDNLEIIISESRRLTNLINDVLDLAKIESGKIEWKIEEIDLKELFREAVKAIKPLLEEKKLYIKEELKGENFKVIGDRERLFQVIMNIFSNAIKFTEKGGITYRIMAEDGNIVCEIEDTGCGIPKDMLGVIFEKFKQVGDALTEKPQGTGLGLPICKEIIKHHGGKIWAESDLGKGSKFVFVLPRKGLLKK
ncbi:MAG: HAMP domain-containing protein [Thermodesulfobacteria bacterium]|nr:HAMP domain-containing protein [Thermodesulfobacteriota bacterium]